jgi:hypothetical protein
MNFHNLLFLDLVLKIAPQQGHRASEILKKRLHKEHLFWPYSYLGPFGALFALKSTQNPLQQNPIFIFLR